MKTIILIVNTIFLFTGGCAGALNEKSKIEPLAAEQLNTTVSDSFSVTEANNRFAFDLYKKLSNNTENLFFSPFSIYSALALAYSGAEGNTKAEIQKVMNISGNDTGFCTKFRELNQKMIEEGDKPPMNINNALWVYDKLNVEEQYNNKMKTYFAAELKKADFVGNPGKSCNEINNWISEKTNGKINNALSPESITPLTRLIMTNTIYFKAEWDKKFDKDYTKKNVFYSYGREKDSVWFMKNVADYGYYEDNLLQVLEIPYQYSRYSLIIFLPKDKDALNKVESAMNDKKFAEYINSLHTNPVSVLIPRFKFNSKYELNNVLSESGMPAAFLPGADFSGITKDDRLQIADISHSAFIEVNEERTEAVASTLIRSISSSAASGNIKMQVFRATSPFLFMINYHDHDINQILFIGKVQTLN